MQSHSLQKRTSDFRFPAIIAALTLAVIFALLTLASCGSASGEDDDVLNVDDSAIEQASGVKHLLFIGDDSWGEYTPGHSDLMLLARIDFDKSIVTLVSVPRDTAYNYNGTMGKANEPYRLGGGTAACKVVSDITGVEVTDFVSIGFSGFQAIVDYFNGIDARTPCGGTYHFYTNDYPDVYFPSGKQHLDGWNAMALSRSRVMYENSGFNDDTARQIVDRDMFVTLMDYLMTNQAGALSVAKSLYGNVSTNMKKSVLLGYVKTLSDAQTITVYTCTGPTMGRVGAVKEAADLWLIPQNDAAWKRLMQDVEAGIDPSATTKTFEHGKLPSSMPIAETRTIVPVK